MEFKLTVMVITYNEETNLPRLLSTIPKKTDIEILVIDSGSEDRTIQIAEGSGARVIHRPFDDYSSQKNFGQQQAKGGWILALDADEEPTSQFWEALSVLLKEPTQHSAYRMKRQLVFLGKMMSFGKTSDSPIRLFKTNSGKYSGDIHEIYQTSGSIGSLSGSVLHHSYKDLSDYFIRFNKYTSMLASHHIKSGRTITKAHVLLRAPLDFIGRYIFRLGFLDGYPGFIYAWLSATYGMIKYAKVQEQSKL